MYEWGRAPKGLWRVVVLLQKGDQREGGRKLIGHGEASIDPCGESCHRAPVTHRVEPPTSLHLTNM